MRKATLLIAILVSIFLLDHFTTLLSPLERAFLIVNTSAYSLKGWLISVLRCASNTSGSVKVLPSGSVLSEWIGGLVVEGEGKVGDAVLDSSGRFVGFVDLALGKVLIVTTVESRSMRLEVELVSDGGDSVVGFLMGGKPPLVEVPEGFDVTGWRVFISRGERLGSAIRSEGGYLGRVVGREGRYFVLETFEIPDEGLRVLEGE